MELKRAGAITHLQHGRCEETAIEEFLDKIRRIAG